MQMTEEQVKAFSGYKASLTKETVISADRYDMGYISLTGHPFFGSRITLFISDKTSNRKYLLTPYVKNSGIHLYNVAMAYNSRGTNCPFFLLPVSGPTPEGIEYGLTSELYDVTKMFLTERHWFPKEKEVDALSHVGGIDDNI